MAQASTTKDTKVREGKFWDGFGLGGWLGDLRNRMVLLAHCWGRTPLLESKQGNVRLNLHA